MANADQPSVREIVAKTASEVEIQIEPDVGNTMECLVTRLGRN